MNRNRNLTVESLEGKMLQATSAIGHAATVLVTPQTAVLPHTPATGTGLTAFTSTAPTGGLPHGPATGTGLTAFAATVPTNGLPHGPATGTGYTAF